MIIEKQWVKSIHQNAWLVGSTQQNWFKEVNYLEKIIGTITKGLDKIICSPKIIVLVMKQVIAQKDCINTIWLNDTRKRLYSTQKEAFKEVRTGTKFYRQIKMIQLQIHLTKGLIFRDLVLIYHQWPLRNKWVEDQNLKHCMISKCNKLKNLRIQIKKTHLIMWEMMMKNIYSIGSNSSMILMKSFMTNNNIIDNQNIHNLNNLLIIAQ